MAPFGPDLPSGHQWTVKKSIYFAWSVSESVTFWDALEAETILIQMGMSNFIEILMDRSHFVRFLGLRILQNP